MKTYDDLKQFYRGKRVLLTGHTGFKGSYLTVLLSLMGAEVYGYALPAPTEPSLFELLYGKGSSEVSREDLSIRKEQKEQSSALYQEPVDAGSVADQAQTVTGSGLSQKLSFAASEAGQICNVRTDPVSFKTDREDAFFADYTPLKESCIGDICDFEKLKNYVNHAEPDVVIHMAAQPIVRESYRIPRETFETNVMGTVNLLEALRLYAQQRKAACENAENRCVASHLYDASPADALGRADDTDRSGGSCRPRQTEHAVGTAEENWNYNRDPRISFLNVTTDKVYKNEEKSGYAYREEDKLDGYDPYSNSKSCSELVTHSYKAAFFGETAGNTINSYVNQKDINQTDTKEKDAAPCAKQEPLVRISTARAGNVIGGGDFARDRIIPDCMRAQLKGEVLGVRNPYSTRPFQHVLEPLMVYLTIAMEQYEDSSRQGCYNVGPDLCDCVTTGELCDLYAEYAGKFTWENRAQADAPHEANFLRLDNTKIKEKLGWQPKWHIREAVKACADWCSAYREGPEAASRELFRQIYNYVN